MNKPRSPLNPPHSRHTARFVKQKTLSREWNTVILPGVNVREDVEAINTGKATRINHQWHINGRIYGEHDGTLYPIEGDDLVRIERSVFKAFGVYNQFGDTARAQQILDAMGLADPTRDAARAAYLRTQEALNVADDEAER